ncbi:hypothetical protein HZ996_01550 [Cryomorphaceae bacterium]|nr:hypothetical protein HZ996_01550 [Cryomorphaceae bacterium]
MIVGLLTLFSILFFGGSQEYFLVEKLEKGVKEYVIEKDRKKEILSDLDITVKTIKVFNKNREKTLREYHDLNASYSSTKADFDTFLQSLKEERVAFQKDILEQRVMVVAKITPEEWSNIIEYSSEKTEKRLEKENKKKEKDAFSKIKQKIDSEISDDEKRNSALQALEQIQLKFNELGDTYASLNALENNLVKDQNTTLEEGEKLGAQLNELRTEMHFAVVSFHFAIKDLSDESTFERIMKTVNKVIL